MDFSLILPILVTTVGLFLLIRLRAFFILHPKRTLCEVASGLSDRGARRALMLALAGTLGVGNIFGVAAGIIIGGPGSLFWLFLSSIFAMIIKYAETLLVFDVGERVGGTSALLSAVFPRGGRLLSPLYAALTVVLALLMGSAMQSSALIDSVGQGLSLSPTLTLCILTFLLIPCIVGKSQKIESITEILIPLTTIIYIIMCLAVIIANFSGLSSVIKSILSSAFKPPSAAVGISLVALKEGFARGILSNEAGVGTSALAHSRSGGRTPHSAGLFAMCEVVFDSLILCMLTGIAILLSSPDYTSFERPMQLVFSCFCSVFSGALLPLLPFVIFAFAYSTMICWFYYGSECASFYFPRLKPIFPVLFIVFAWLSGRISPITLVYLTDIPLLFMSVMTLSAIVKCTDRIVVASKAKK